jgi:hypothetical protein
MLPTAVRVEPVRANPALLPNRVPPEFVKLADAVIGCATASKNSHMILFIMTPFLLHSSELQVVVLRR